MPEAKTFGAAGGGTCQTDVLADGDFVGTTPDTLVPNYTLKTSPTTLLTIPFVTTQIDTIWVFLNIIDDNTGSFEPLLDGNGGTGINLDNDLLGTGIMMSWRLYQWSAIPAGAHTIDINLFAGVNVKVYAVFAKVLTTNCLSI